MKLPSMEKLSLESEMFLCPAIFILYSVSFVSDYRMSDIRHMHTDLVSASSLESHLQETESFSLMLKNFEGLVVRCRFTSFDRVFYGHPETIIWIATNDRMNSPGSVARFSDDESEIGFFYFVVVDEFLEISECDIIFCDEEKTARIFI